MHKSELSVDFDPMLISSSLLGLVLKDLSILLPMSSSVRAPVYESVLPFWL
jgi:hypothetical protein